MSKQDGRVWELKSERTSFCACMSAVANGLRNARSKKQKHNRVASLLGWRDKRKVSQLLSRVRARVES